MLFIKHLKKDIKNMFATKITQNIKTLIKNAPVVTIDSAGVYLYGSTSTSANEDAAYQTLIGSLKSKAEEQKLMLHGF
jgi:hypothetical protein